MNTIQVHDKSFIGFLSHEEILTRIEEIGNQINADYKGKNPLFIAILNGSFMFASDLFKSLHIEAEICFIKLASYKGIKSTGQVTTSIGLDVSLKDRDVILIEDIVDTGKTLHEFLPQLFNQNPSSIRIASLLHKPDALLFPIKVDYLGFEVPNKFLVGYGLDYDGLGRNLKDIYQLKIIE
jgi:hypoxanthine phosphoribosyltransferase